MIAGLETGNPALPAPSPDRRTRDPHPRAHFARGQRGVSLWSFGVFAFHALSKRVNLSDESHLTVISALRVRGDTRVTIASGLNFLAPDFPDRQVERGGDLHRKPNAGLDVPVDDSAHVGLADIAVVTQASERQAHSRHRFLNSVCVNCHIGTLFLRVGNGLHYHHRQTYNLYTQCPQLC